MTVGSMLTWVGRFREVIHLEATQLDNPHWMGDMGKSGGWMIGQMGLDSRGGSYRWVGRVRFG